MSGKERPASKCEKPQSRTVCAFHGADAQAERGLSAGNEKLEVGWKPKV